MKVQVTNNTESQFLPKLMISVEGVIVFFYEQGCGVVVNNSDFYKPGEHRDCWSMEKFCNFNGTVTLSND